jgi:hypothetical protein
VAGGVRGGERILPPLDRPDEERVAAAPAPAGAKTGSTPFGVTTTFSGATP